MKNIFLWLVIGIVWSSSFAAIKIGIEGMTPMALVAGRMVVATSILLIFMKLKSLSFPKDSRTWGLFLIIGLSGNLIPFYLISFGEIYVGSGLASLLMSITPIATVFIAPLILADENYSLKASAGIILGVFGILLLVGFDAITGIGENVGAQFAIILAALFYSFTTIFVRRFVNEKPLVMASGSMLVGSIIMIIIVFMFESPSQYIMPDTNSILAMIYLGIFPTALATVIYFYLVPKIGASRISQINFLVPVLGAFIGVFIMGETLKMTSIYALIIILLAIYLVTSRRKSSR